MTSKVEKSLMYLIRASLCSLFLLFSFLSYAQNHINGKVISADGAPLGGTNITILGNDKNLINFTVTGENGEFSIKIDKSIPGPLQINARKMNYAFSSQTIENKSQNIEFSVNYYRRSDSGK
ncbi:carboxypeptidase-like regulatory domain-containing protein [Sphingobacterium sp. UT-1RO-CII-1]|uniref:carboxypeptidase-like regulatory domain-containing protein n=1 Tax=Sphingobacterium sp. UT-1RO-CII-1 TaxID=2995225 RepID=UPI00227BAC55|nr:carboxypeptidase-like regulatory domain-containing protein [Sphingobacterium sp. UT-1RO-CII-1]MCY4781189.1 carboxypeptidase-like regulatory domain-containing protein [Sphingobacterium sp. UT-1RO-CII-1]